MSIIAEKEDKDMRVNVYNYMKVTACLELKKETLQNFEHYRALYKNTRSNPQPLVIIAVQHLVVAESDQPSLKQI